MAEIVIGTSGYDYLDWRGVFYGDGVPRESFLSFYSGEFRSVELNFSYYRMPVASQLDSFAERSGGKLLFSIKAHESMTHKITSDWKESVFRFKDALVPLIERGKLASLLLQFPYSFHYTPENRKYLDSLTKELGDIPVVVEFRNSEWFTRRVFDALRDKSVGFCSTDMPDLKGLPPAVDLVTSSLAYIRFHGRNSGEWWGSDAAERFNYLYSASELKGWVSRVKSMSEKASLLQIYFNNHRNGQAVRNAKMLIDILKIEGLI